MRFPSGDHAAAAIGRSMLTREISIPSAVIVTIVPCSIYTVRPLGPASGAGVIVGAAVGCGVSLGGGIVIVAVGNGVSLGGCTVGVSVSVGEAGCAVSVALAAMVLSDV